MASVVGTEAAASLQVSAHWWPDEDEVDALLADAAGQLGVPAAAVTVAVGPARVHRVTLAARAGDRVLALATSSSSGSPPYTAVLTAPVRAELLPLVRRALEGEPGVLSVRYDVSAEGARATRVLDVGAAMAEAPSGSGHVFVIPAPPDAQPPAGPYSDPSAPSLPLRVTAPVGEPPVRAIDLAVADQAGGDWTVTIPSSGPAPASLPAAESLEITVHGESGKPYRLTLPADASGWTVDDAALGVVTATFQAPGRSGGAVVSLEAWYQPAGDGLPDHGVITLTAPTWSASWRVASSRRDLDGELVVDVSETTGDGVAVPKHTIRSTSADVRV